MEKWRPEWVPVQALQLRERIMFMFFVLLVDLVAGKLASNHNQSRLVG